MVYFAFRNANLPKMLEDIKKANYAWIALSVCFSIIACMSRAYRWGMLIEPFHKRPKFKNLFRSVNSGYLANLAFPRLGEVTRCTALYEVEGSSIESLIGTVIVERIIDLLFMLLLICLTLLLNASIVAGVFRTYMLPHFAKSGAFVLHHPLVMVLLLAVMAGLVLLFVKLRARLFQLAIVVKLNNFKNGIIDGLKAVLNLKNKKEFIFHSFFIWMLYYLSAYVAFFAFAPTTTLGMSAALVTLTFGTVGMTIPAPGGIGSYQFFVALGLEEFYGLSNGDGTTFATIVLASQVLLMLVQGSFGILFLNIEKRRLLKNATS